jgi:hypothetical protein
MFDRANQWLSERIAENRARKHGTLAVNIAGLRIVRHNSSTLVPWSDITEVVAIRKDAFIGDTLGLILRLSDGTALKVMEHDPAWKPLVEAIDRYLPGSLPYPQWSLRTAFTDPKGVVEVYRKASAKVAT